MRDLNCFTASNSLIEPHRNRIHRLRQCFPQSDFAGVLPVVVARCPTIDRQRQIVCNRIRRHAALKRCQIDERLERGSRLAMGFDGAIELTLGIVAAADQRANAAVSIQHRNRCLTDAERRPLLR